jgi:hypothetical protein
LLSRLLSAQVEINGTADVEVGVGGKDSEFIVNEIASEFYHPHMSISQLNLFLFSPLTANFSFNMRLQFDTWGSGKLNNARLTLAMLNWESDGSAINLGIGRYINPFGLYPRRNLAADNLMAQAPLVYGYFINMSDIRGFWPALGNTGTYGTDDVGMTTVYFGGYNTGGLFSWIISPNRVNLDIALANQALASTAAYTNLTNAAAITRLGIQPLIFWQQGFSASYGSFLQRDPQVNAIYDDLHTYRQLVVGTDLILAFSYFELSGEFIYSLWNVPAYNKTDTSYIEISIGVPAEFELQNYGAYADLKIEPPFLTGSYLAFRYDILRFKEYDHPNTSVRASINPWDYDVNRYSVAVGYKFARSVLLKIAYSDQQTNDPNVGENLYTIRGILTVSF